MKASNTSINDTKACNNANLRERLHQLKIGETLVTTEPGAQRLANSLSRTTKVTTGTQFTVRTVEGRKAEIQCVRYYAPRIR
jgi:uncharacterized membrane protein YfbV (UPF0208 family)